MNGCGVHTFKLIDSEGGYVYARFNWRVDQELKNLSAEEAIYLTGKNPDYLLHDLFDNIARGNYPSWTLTVQILTTEQAALNNFNPFDATKVWFTDEIPEYEVGKLILNRNQDNYFNDVEQSAFDPANMPLGIEPSPDKLLQGRLFSYLDTQYYRVAQLEVITKRPNGPIIYSCLFICIFSSTLIVYTSIFYIMIGEFSKAVPSYCMTGIMASTYAAAWNVVLKDRMKWVPLLEFAAQKIYRDDKPPTAYNRICSECMDNTVKTFVITITVIMLSFDIALIGPVYTYLQDGSIVTLYEVRIPFLQDDPEKEFFINMIWQVYISLVGVAGLFGIEGASAIVNNTITVTSKLTVQEFYDLSDLMEVGKISGEESGQRLIEIFMKIIYMDRYIGVYRDLSYWRQLLAPPSFTIAIAISIYSQYVLEYPAGYGIAVVSYVQMVVMCITGQNIANRNERILQALYQFKWYLLPTKYQKDYKYMILHLQNKKGLTIGPFGPLNYESLKDVRARFHVKKLTQKIYSFLMFLMSINT